MGEHDDPAEAGSGSDQSVPQPTAAPPKEPTERSVDEWAGIVFPPAPSGRLHPEAWKHGAASTLHRWASYAHHHNEPKKLSREDYDACIEAAAKCDEKGTYTPHEAGFCGDEP